MYELQLYFLCFDNFLNRITVEILDLRTQLCISRFFFSLSMIERNPRLAYFLLQWWSSGSSCTIRTRLISLIKKIYIGQNENIPLSSLLGLS